ncbi:MAG: hypothetical protein ABFD61_08085 [Chloroherpetonaceae bacterium]
MTDYIDKSPIPNTCPVIDKIIDAMQLAIYEAEYITRDSGGSYEFQTNWIIGGLNIAISDMEKIRQENQAMRKWAIDEHQRAEEAKKERDDAIERYDVLELEINYLREQLKEEVEYGTIH